VDLGFFLDAQRAGQDGGDLRVGELAYSAALGAGDLGDAHLVAGAGVGPGARGLQVLARAAAHGVGFGHAVRITAGGRPVPRIGGAGLLGQRAGVAAQGGKQAAHALAHAGVMDRGARDFLALRPDAWPDEAVAFVGAQGREAGEGVDFGGAWFGHGEWLSRPGRARPGA
jgi:hypothetical protein